MISKSEEIRFEPTTFCNYRCIICENPNLARKKETMSYDLFKKILDKILAETDQYKIVSFAGIGDPLMDRDLESKIYYVNKRGLRPIMVTNGFLLTPKRFRTLERFGLYSVRISFHGATSESYSKLHGVDKSYFEQVRRNVQQIIKIKSTTKVLLTCVIVNGVNDQDIEAWKEMWNGDIELKEIWRAHNWVDRFKFRDIQNSKKFTCGRIDNGPLQIQVDGCVVPCCFDYNNNIIFGNIKTQSLSEIFSSNTYNKVAECHKTGNFKNSGLICEDCDQRNLNKLEALIYSSRHNAAERVNQTSTSYENLGGKGL